jgi:hypothetical protein
MKSIDFSVFCFLSPRKVTAFLQPLINTSA